MKLNRRDFLKGLAASSLLAPYSRVGKRIPSEPPSRLAIFFSPNGTVHQHWRQLKHLSIRIQQRQYPGASLGHPR